MNQNSHAQASRTTSLVSVASENPDNNMTIIDGGLSNEDLADSISLRKSLSIPNKKQTLRQCDQIVFFVIIKLLGGRSLLHTFKLKSESSVAISGDTFLWNFAMACSNGANIF